VALGLTAGILALGPVSPVEATWNHPLPRWWYDELATCETGLNVRHSTRSYVSAFGIYRGTWDRWADTPNRRAHLLTYAQQARVVDRIAWFGHTENGRKQWPVGPWGWGCVKLRPRLQYALCQSTHPRVAKWKRGC
jgi:hypothetical protein